MCSVCNRSRFLRFISKIKHLHKNCHSEKCRNFLLYRHLKKEVFFIYEIWTGNDLKWTQNGHEWTQNEHELT